MAFALSNFVPSNVVTGLMVEELRNNLVFSDLIRVSTPEGLGKGASYKVPGVGAITIRDYAGTDITVEAQADIGATITIDQEKYFAFYADYVDSAEAAYDVLPAYINKATYGLSNALDAFLGSALVSSAAVQVTAPTSGTIDSSNVLDFLADIQYKMDVANIPTAGRWVVVPPSVNKALVKANVAVTSTTDEAVRATGRVAELFGLGIYVSNNLKSAGGGKVTVVGGTNEAADLVMTLSQFESVVAPNRFATINRGLLVFGAGVNQWGGIINSDVVA